jgi:hypothetical protein
MKLLLTKAGVYFLIYNTKTFTEFKFCRKCGRDQRDGLFNRMLTSKAMKYGGPVAGSFLLQVKQVLVCYDFFAFDLLDSYK